MVRLVAYLAGVGAMGLIAQAVVGTSLHDVLWATRERPVRGETRIVTETARGRTVTERVSTTAVGTRTIRGETVAAPASTTFVTVAGPRTTSTVSGPALTTTISGGTETVRTPGPTVTTTVSGPATTTTVHSPAVTTTEPGTTVTVTVTVSDTCQPPPKKPSNPPCPPHK